ncbi:MAG: hypothetical protein C0478_17960 [Planctomyces sp.]|nr:hypothetical protein [Planctomyces sp.]
MADRRERSHVAWVKRLILFHNKRHPREMGPTEVREFLTHLAVIRASEQGYQHVDFKCCIRRRLQL